MAVSLARLRRFKPLPTTEQILPSLVREGKAMTTLERQARFACESRQIAFVV